jgi:alpha-glucosidase
MSNPESTSPESTSPWWANAVVYQVYPRSFADANGDGTGDLAGVSARMPYIAALGVDAIWLSPFYPSPQHDSGYDVRDPRDVDPMYGSLDDARQLIQAAHSRGLRVIVDIVPNHFSTEHPWFVEALASEPGSRARARFHFRPGRGEHGDEPPNNWLSLFTGPAWTRVNEPDGTPGDWYLNMFDSTQADLNWTNPDVHEDFISTLRFWLDLGADGFRIDVAFGLAKDMTYADAADPAAVLDEVRLDLPSDSSRHVDMSHYLDRDEVHDIYREWRRVLDSYPDDRMAVAEAWVPPDRARAYVQPDTLHQIFNFDFLAAPWNAGDLRRIIDSTMIGLDPAPVTWALSNHDSPRVVSRLGGGARRDGEAAPDRLAQGLARARGLALLAQALPGSLYVYQGEELGLPDADIPPDRRQDPLWFRSGGQQVGRDGARVPLPWSGSQPPYGFGAPHTWLPQPDDWADLTVQAQERQPGSTLNLYRDGLRLRHAHPGLRPGQPLSWVDVAPDIVAFRRGAGFMSITNCGGASADLPAGSVLLSSQPLEGSTIPADTTVWLQT